MEGYEFHNVEVLDGYFSGVIFICNHNNKYIFDVNYDIEFEKLYLNNCSDILYGKTECSIETLEEIKNRHYYEIKEAILEFINYRGYVVYADGK